MGCLDDGLRWKARSNTPVSFTARILAHDAIRIVRRNDDGAHVQTRGAGSSLSRAVATGVTGLAVPDRPEKRSTLPNREQRL